MKQQCSYCLKKKYTAEERISQIQNLGWKFVAWCTPYKNPSTIVTVECSNHHQFSASLDSLIYTKSGCAKCSKCYRYTPQEYIDRISEAGWKFIEWVDEPPTISSKVIVECDHGHITSRFIDDIVNAGTGCNTCATLNRIGFLHQRSPNDPLYYEPTTLYCLHFQSNVDTEEFWKVGVTSKRNARIPHDARNYTISVVETFHTTYNIAFHIEQQAKRILQHHYPICKFGGYTECYLDNPLNFIKGELARNIQ